MNREELMQVYSSLGDLIYVSVVEDIKHEIKLEITASWYKGKHEEYRDGLNEALEIINKHIGENNNG